MDTHVGHFLTCDQQSERASEDDPGQNMEKDFEPQ